MYRPVTVVSRVASALLALCCWLGGVTAGRAAHPAVSTIDTAHAQPAPPPSLVPELRLSLTLTPRLQNLPPPQPVLLTPEPAAETPKVFEKWWFWTAVGVVVIGTGVVLVLAATRGPGKPSTRLGNMEAPL